MTRIRLIYADLIRDDLFDPRHSVVHSCDSSETLIESTTNLFRHLANNTICPDARALPHPSLLSHDVLSLRFHGDLACAVRLRRERRVHLHRSTRLET